MIFIKIGEGIMSFEFKNWKKFRNYMKEEDISIAKFEFKYYTCIFDIIYGIEQNVFFVGKKGTQISFPIYLDWYKASIGAIKSRKMFTDRFERINKYRNNLYHGNPGTSGWRQIIEDIEDILVQLNYNLEDAINNIDPEHKIINLKYQYSLSKKVKK